MSQSLAQMGMMIDQMSNILSEFVKVGEGLRNTAQMVEKRMGVELESVPIEGEE